MIVMQFLLNMCRAVYCVIPNAQESVRHSRLFPVPSFWALSCTQFLGSFLYLVLQIWDIDVLKSIELIRTLIDKKEEASKALFLKKRIVFM